MIRAKLAWLMLTALVIGALIYAVGERKSVVPVHYSTSPRELADALQFPLRGGTPGTSLLGIDAIRANLTADMMFLLAFGVLLFFSARILRLQTMAWIVVPVILFDAVESLSTLRLLTDLEFRWPKGAVDELWIFPVMNWSSHLKWLTAAVLLGAVGYGWTRFKSRNKTCRWIAALLFFVGGIGSALTGVGLQSAAAVALFAPLVAFFVQAGILGALGHLARMTYLLRVPALVLFFLAGFSPAAFGPLRSVLGGILEIAGEHNLRSLFLVTATSLMIAAAAVTEIKLIRAYSSARFDDAMLSKWRTGLLGKPVFFAGLLAAFELSLSTLIADSSKSADATAASVKEIVVGLFVVFAATAVVGGIVFVVELATALLSTPAPGVMLTPYVIPRRLIPRVDQFLDSAYMQTPPPLAFKGWLGDLLPATGGEGYFFLNAAGKRLLLAGHTLAVLLAIVSVLTYGILAFIKWPADQGAEYPVVPTLVSILALTLVLGWILSATAFFVDRYRVPLLTAVLGFSMVTGVFTAADHRFLVVSESPGAQDLRKPGTVLNTISQGGPVFALAIAGGGIQAAAWGQRVIDGIDASFPGLRSHTAVVSSVSGGSLTALYFGASYRSDAPWSQLVRQASLDQVATGLIGPDALRVTGIPFLLSLVPKLDDRGMALEESWRLRLPDSERDRTIAEWAQVAGTHLARGIFAAFIFNSTVSETGQPVVFASADIGGSQCAAAAANNLKESDKVSRVENLLCFDPGQTVRVTTAARLSATFPYVSPAAAPAEHAKYAYHLVDGGYCDNYGLVALTQWLDAALAQSAQTKRQIVVIVIRGGFSSSDPPKLWGWPKQIIAPPATALNTRSYGQWAEGNQLLDLLKHRWSSETGSVITPVLADYPAAELLATAPACAETPLNWKLTPIQKNCIDNAWDIRRESVEAGIRTAIGR